MRLGVWLAGAASAGAGLGVGGAIEVGIALAAALGCASAAVALDHRRTRTALGLLAALALCAAHGASARRAALEPSIVRWLAAATADGAVSDVVEIAGTLQADAAAARGGGVRVAILVDHVRPVGGSVWTAASGRVLVHIAGGQALSALDRWTRGRRVTAPAALRPPSVVRNPGSPSVVWQTLVRDVALLGSVKSAAVVAVSPAAWWEEWAARARAGVRQRVDARLGDRPRAAGIVRAILVGDRSGLDPDIEARLLEAGTYHIIAISGSNIAILTVLLTGVLGLVCRSPRRVALLTIPGVALYGWVVGGEPSVVRAVSAALVWCIARALDLAARPSHVLATVVLGVCVLDPLMVTRAGAWLSFGATLGILLFAGPCSAALHRAMGAPAGVTGRIGAALAGLVGTTIAVELVLLPVGALVFSRVTLAAPLTNIVAVPAAALAQIGGFAIVAFEPWVPLASKGAGLLATFAVDAIVETPRWLSWAPWLTARTPPPPWWLAAGFYATASAAALSNGRPHARRALSATAVASALAMATGVASVAARLPSGVLRVTLLDVGQGEAVVIQFPGGRTILVDAGMATDSWDVGERVVAPALWALGVRRLDRAAFTHADLDHIGGLESIVRDFRPGELWEGIAVPPDEPRRRLAELARSRGVVWREVRRGDRVAIQDATVEVLHPEEPDWERPRVRNDDSIVMLVRYGPAEVLLTGDISAAVEQQLRTRLANDPDRRPIRVLKLAHHGSRSSTSDEWLEAYRPSVAMVSVGRANPFGHPAPAVVDRLGRRAIPLFRTDRDGAVTIEVDARGARVEAWSTRMWLAARPQPPSPSLPPATRPRGRRSRRDAGRGRYARRSLRALRTDA